MNAQDILTKAAQHMIEPRFAELASASAHQAEATKSYPEDCNAG